MASPGEDWKTFFQKTPKPSTYEETRVKLDEFVGIKKQEQNKIVLVSVGISVVTLRSQLSDKRRYLDWASQLNLK